MAKILIVEDDEDFASDLASWLKMEHHVVDVVSDGNAAFGFMASGFYQLIILDWELPGTTGIELLRRFRQQPLPVPVLMLTGRSALADKVAGLEIGAHDYLTKPFEPDELSARVRALLRRQPSADNLDGMRLGNLIVDPLSFAVYCQGKEVDLRRIEFRCLHLLAEHLNKAPISPDMFLHRLWDGHGTPEVVRTSLSTLRKKLKDAGATVSIENTPGFGYTLVVDKHRP